MKTLILNLSAKIQKLSEEILQFRGQTNEIALIETNKIVIRSYRLRTKDTIEVKLIKYPNCFNFYIM